jgi:hypothetical protein
MEQSEEINILTIKLKEARFLAEKAQAGRADQAGKDYYLHAQEVRAIVNNMIFSWYGSGQRYEEISLKAAIVSLLYNVLEDTEMTIKDLQDHNVPYGCINAIEALTKIDEKDENEYLAKVKSNKLATIVKIAEMKYESDLSRLAAATPEDPLKQEQNQRDIKFLSVFQCGRCGSFKHVGEMSDRTTKDERPLCASCVEKYELEHDEYEEWIERRSR